MTALARLDTLCRETNLTRIIVTNDLPVKQDHSGNRPLCFSSRWPFLVRSFSTLGGGIGVRVKGLGTGTLILSDATISPRKVIQALPGSSGRVRRLVILKVVTVAHPTPHAFTVLTIDLLHVLNVVTGGLEFFLAFLGNHAALVVCCRCVYGRESKLAPARQTHRGLGNKDPRPVNDGLNRPGDDGLHWERGRMVKV